ncbi:MAG: Rieske 2Fe-2S domain-containing protein [Acidobacteriota bacterium]
MPLVDDLKMPIDVPEYRRRAFLNATGLSAMGLAGFGTAITTVRYLWAEVLFEDETRFKFGNPEEIPVGTLVSLREQKIYLFHDAQGFVAMTATCTHPGCLTRYEKEQNRIFCPCHGNRFTTQGDGFTSTRRAPSCN